MTIYLYRVVSSIFILAMTFTVTIHIYTSLKVDQDSYTNRTNHPKKIETTCVPVRWRSWSDCMSCRRRIKDGAGRDGRDGG